MSVDVGKLQRDLAMCRMPFYRGAYGRGERLADALIDAGGGPPDRKSLDEKLARGVRSIIWLGAYDRKELDGSCTFERSDDWLRQRIPPIAGHDGILAYQITDEPNGATDCPDVVAHMERRRALLAELDPATPTYVTLRTGTDWAPFANVADLFGLVAYPVSVKGYNAEKIPSTIAKAEAAGLPAYGAVMQMFATSWYRLPTPDELARQIAQWSGSRWRGFMLYHWTLGGLDDSPAHREVLREAVG